MSAHTKRYALTTLITSALIIAVIGAFNFFIDPYNKFGNNKLGVYISCEREFKETEIRKHLDNYDMLVFGSSKCAMINTSAIDHHRTFNAAFGGGKVSEVYEFVKKYIHEPKLLIIGFDVLESASVSSMPKNKNAIADYLIGLKTTEYSFKTIAKYIKKAPTALNKDGSFNPERWYKKHEVENPGLTKHELDRLIRSYQARSFSEEDMYYYKKLKALLDSRNIPHHVYLHPLHDQVITTLESSSTSQAILAFKSELLKIFPETVDLSNSEYSRASNFFKTDPVHYKPEVGAHIINRELLSRQ